ncbi:MAG: hypothetical protein M3342_24035, partial [Bacteroidota bacterium]|nr:hypothetical protein [Bacteroidota bacterium]
ITLAYDFAPSMIKLIGMSSLQVYISGQNLITVTKYSGYDPEVQNANAAILGWDRGNYPSTKSVTGGVRVNF